MLLSTLPKPKQRRNRRRGGELTPSEGSSSTLPEISNAPILPDELWLYIFLLYVRSPGSPMFLGRMCRLWRALAFSYGALWENLHIAIPSRDRPAIALLPELRFWMRTAANLNRLVNLDLTSSPQHTEARDRVYAELPLVSDQLRSLSISLDGYKPATFPNAALRGRFHNLERLALRGNWTAPEMPYTAFEIAPRLVHVELQDLQTGDTAGSVAPDEDAEFFAALPSMHTLAIDTGGGFVEATPTSVLQRAMEHIPAMRRVIVQGCDGSEVTPLEFKELAAHGLRQGTIELDPVFYADEEPDAPQFRAAIERARSIFSELEDGVHIRCERGFWSRYTLDAHAPKHWWIG